MLPLRTPPLDLPNLLAPLTFYLDTCWLYFGGQDILCPFPPEFPRNNKDPSYPAAMQVWQERSERWHHDLQSFVDMSKGVAKPGFFSRFAAGLPHDWVAYCFADTPDCPNVFDSIDSIRLFNHPQQVPPEICLSLRN